ncbi:3-deoxy-D-manno-octulosonic acid transferase, partial [Lichenihabitans sp. Uapishka_5]|uniref:3-deoxy-D-manno-octulosonic acid transferase n=1 Tax=Lichenihabitans sp. Uapishka_5 TaxID=3037302 RepID=UPI0029E7E6EB
MPEAPLWGGYRVATALLERGAPAFLRWRLRHGKEDAARLPERLGHAALSRPTGPLVWLHGASVGEALALLPLIERLRTAELAVLLTTGTLSSAAVMAVRLPAGALHQFVPLDGPAAARRFLDHWRPDLVLFAESELWPNLLGAARQRGIPVALVNARMSTRSFGRWRRVPALARSLLGSLTTVLAQSEADAERYRGLGAAAVLTVGNLKYDAAPPPADPDALRILRAAVGERSVWVAASTQPGEDLACLAVHAALKAHRPDLLLVLVPRHVGRATAIEAEAARLGLAAAVRSRMEPVTATTDVHVADTMGELGLFYRLGAPVFMGKSLGPEGGGGQNPIEPANLGNAVLHGPAIGNFRDVYAGLDAAGGARPVADAAALSTALEALLNDPQ